MGKKKKEKEDYGVHSSLRKTSGQNAKQESSEHLRYSLTRGQFSAIHLKIITRNLRTKQ